MKIYIAGKVSKDSRFGTHYWREEVCKKITNLTGINITNLDPTKDNLDESNPELIFGRDCFFIKRSDAVIVYLTDDISVGGSIEMLIAKYFNKYLIGIAPLEGKFNKRSVNLMGENYTNWKHPFVATLCDEIVENVEEAAKCIKKFNKKSDPKIKNIKIINDSIKYYLELTNK